VNRIVLLLQLKIPNDPVVSMYVMKKNDKILHKYFFISAYIVNFTFLNLIRKVTLYLKS